MTILAAMLFVAVFPAQALTDAARADALYRNGEFKSAAEIYRGLVQQDPNDEKAQTGLIRSLLKNNEVDDSHATALKAQEALPASSAVMAALGDVLFREGDLEGAARLYVRARQADARNARAYLGLAKVHASDFNRKSTRLMAQKAYKCDSDDPEIIYAFAMDLPADERIPLLERYLELGTNEPEARKESARHRISYLKMMGDRRTWILQGEPRAASFELQAIAPSAGQRTGYRMKASINGRKPVDLQFDTGASGLMIQQKLAQKLGIEVISEAAVRGIGDDGRRKSYVGLAASVRFGEVEFRDCTIDVSEKKLLGNTEGLIGSVVFEQFLIRLNLPEYRVELEPLPPIAGRRYDDPKSWNDLDRTPIPELNEFVPVRHWGHLLMDTLVNEKLRGFFFLDTGAADNFISQELARRVTSLQSSNAIIRGISGNVKDVALARNVVLQVGRFRQQNHRIWAISFKEMSKNLGFEISGLLGHPLLSHLAIVIDYRDGLLNLIYPDKNKK